MTPWTRVKDAFIITVSVATAVAYVFVAYLVTLAILLYLAARG